MLKYTRFGTGDIPTIRGDQEHTTGEAVARFYPLSQGGVYDDYGTLQAPTQGSTVRIAGGLDGTPAHIWTTHLYPYYLAMVGKRDKLYRECGDGTIHWAYARCMSVSSNRTPSNVGHIDLTLEFQILSPCWNGIRHGAAWILDDGHYLDAGLYLDDATDSFTCDANPKAMAITNAGLRDIYNPVITITAGASDITHLDLYGTAIHLNFTGTITASKSLVIDCGAYSIKNNGSDAYSNFSLDAASHQIDQWMKLPANQEITITANLTTASTGSVISWAFYDGWA